MPLGVEALDECRHVDVAGSMVVVRSVESAMHDVAFPDRLQWHV